MSLAQPERATVVKVWTWRRILRDDGPRDRNKIIIPTLMMISTWMDGDGFAYPGLRSIADACRCNERTVRRHIDIAVKLGWIRITKVNTGGQGWRRHEYQACIPARIELSDVDEELQDCVISQFGDLNEGVDTAMSTRSSESTQRPDIFDKGPDISAPRSGHLEPKVRTQLCPLNSIRTLQDNSPREGTPSGAPLKKNGKGKKKSQDLRSAVMKLAKTMNPDKIAKMYNRPISEIQQIIEDGQL